jgi:site-specific DNA-adenine methylase
MKKTSIYFTYTGHKLHENKELANFNYENINKIVEPFCGMFGFSYYSNLKKFLVVDEYILNDTDTRLINFLKDVKDNKLSEYVDYFNKNYKKMYDDINNFHILRNNDKINNKFNYFLHRHLMGGYGGRMLRYYGSTKREHLIKNLDINIFDDLNVIIEKSKLFNLDFREIIKKYKDDENCLIYFDPPYLSSFNSNYEDFNHEKTKEIIDNTGMYIDILEFMKSCKCKFILLINDNAITRYLYKDFICKNYGHTYQGTKKTTKHMIVTNLKQKIKK